MTHKKDHVEPQRRAASRELSRPGALGGASPQLVRYWATLTCPAAVKLRRHCAATHVGARVGQVDEAGCAACRELLGQLKKEEAQ